MTRKGDSPGRRAMNRTRRRRESHTSAPTARGEPDTALARTGAIDPNETAVARRTGWDADAPEPQPERRERDTSLPLTAQLLSLLSDPRIPSLSPTSAARLLGFPRVDVQTAIDALVQAGELQATAGAGEIRYVVGPDRKQEYELMFRDAADDLGETTALAKADAQRALVLDDDEEPRLPVTAGLLSLFLPGTGQLLNGDVGRASLVFAVWSLALLTHLNPIWTFVALYAGAEAFFTAKIRGMERKLALENAKSGGGKPEPNRA